MINEIMILIGLSIVTVLSIKVCFLINEIEKDVEDIENQVLRGSK